jgi:B12-binding domain/radical SAM domain protein
LIYDNKITNYKFDLKNIVLYNNDYNYQFKLGIFLLGTHAFLVYYHRYNFFSLNAIVASLEREEIFANVDFYFSKARNELINTIEELLKTYHKIVIGISFYTTQIFDIYSLVQHLRDKFKEKIFIIAGGAHPTGDPSGTLKMGFDVAVVGEGESTIIELMKAIITNKPYKGVKGIAYLSENAEYIYTGKQDLIDLNKYPPFPTKNTRYGAIEITRGCPYICYFCQTPYILGAIPRHRSIEMISKYVQELKNHYGDLTDIRFITPNAFSYGSIDGRTLNLEVLEDLIRHVRKILGEKGRIFLGSFPSEVRPEHVTQNTLDLVLKYADNDNITIGAQSGSQKLLDLCHRGHSVQDITNAVDLTLKNNLKINVDFIFGLPGEDDEDIELTITLMKNLSEKGARIHAHSFLPLPQTPFAKESAGKINKKYIKEIKNLISKGIAFGNWKKQEQLAFRITKYYENKRFE